VSESLLVLCGLVLAFGAAGEHIDEHGRLPHWMEWSRKPKLVFVWMVALSLIGEFAGDAGVFLFSRAVQAIQDQESNDLRARLIWQGARDIAINASKDAFAMTLQRFAGQKAKGVVCGAYAFDGALPAEPTFTEEAIRQSLTGAGWMIILDDPRSPTPTIDHSCIGGETVSVDVRWDAPPRTREAGRALQVILNEVLLQNNDGPSGSPAQPPSLDTQKLQAYPPAADTIVYFVARHPAYPHAPKAKNR